MLTGSLKNPLKGLKLLGTQADKSGLTYFSWGLQLFSQTVGYKESLALTQHINSSNHTALINLADIFFFFLPK